MSRSAHNGAWISAALDPASVAIIGASENPEKIGGRPIKYMKAHGYRGAVYPINPSRSEIQGLRSYPDISALPAVPEMAIVCIPGQLAVEAVEECAQRGVKICVIISSGFGETGAEGRQLQDRMLDAARRHGMRLVGPNTQGLVNFGSGAIASFATLIGELGAEDGPVAIVSQSGAMSVVPYAFLRAEGIGVRHAHATGNECDLTVSDFALAVAQDPGVRLILLYMESISDPATLSEAARVARARGVPIVALKAGVSSRGQAAASSHTGALATEDKVVDAFFRQAGILRVSDMRSLVQAARVLFDGARLDGRRVAAISNSGACCVMAADAAERHGLDLEPLAPHTRSMLESVLPPFASAANPIDLTAALLSNSKLFSQVLPLLAPNDVADAYFISLPMSGKGYDVPQFAQDTASFAKQTGKPTVVASPLASTRELFERAGVATFEHDEDAMLALGQLARVAALQKEAERLAGTSVKIVKTGLPVSAEGFLSESDSLACLAELGIPVASYRVCRSRQELAVALREVPGPWVVKACSAEIPHKTEYGLVKLGVADSDAAISAFDTITEVVQKLGKRLDGVIVASMLRTQREMIIGARWDAKFGSIVMIGDGGKYVEAMPDVVTLIHPFDVEHCLSRMQALRMAPLFSGVRGEPPLSARHVAEIAVTLGNWVHSHAGRVKSADINPLMLGSAGAVAAADALVELVRS